VKNTTPDILEGVDLNHYRIPFEIAALMHDCAHAPFSHTCENYYEGKQVKDFSERTDGAAPATPATHVDHEHATNLLLSLASSDPSFRADYAALKLALKVPKPHEIFSSAIFLKHFSGEFATLTSKSPVLVARMITGCVHNYASTIEKQIENCLISLINGSTIDVDKLDYIMRDVFVSGVNGVNIDANRLLSSLTLQKYDHHLEAVYNKSALSCIQSVVNGRNFLSYWIHTHHTVAYFNTLLKKKIKEMLHHFSPEDNPTLLEQTIFSEECFSEPVTANGHTFFLPTDGDVLSLLKKMAKDDDEIIELLSRSPRRIPLWKTRAEYENMLRDKNASQRARVFSSIERILGDVLPEEAMDHVCKVEATHTMQFFALDDLYINVRGTKMSFSTAVPELRRSDPRSSFFFYVYIPKTHIDLKNDCIDAIQQYHPY